MATIEIRVPDIGNYTGVEVIEVAVKPGMQVNKEETLITLETEKASMDVPAPLGGKILELKIKLGDKVSQGDLIALLEVLEEAKQDVKDQSKEEKAEIRIEDKESPNSQAAKSQSSQGSKAAAPQKEEVITIRVPDTGAAKQVEIIEVPIKVGDTVKEEDTLITLESEKASMDIPSPYAGKIESVLVKMGDKVKEGDAIAILRATIGAKIESPSTPVSAQSIVPTQSTPVIKAASVSSPATAHAKMQDFSGMHAGPATRRMARELGVDLTQVKGTGLKGRIVTKDIQEFVKSVMQGARSGGGSAIEKAPEIDFSQFGEIEAKPLSRIKKWTGKNLHRNWVTIPHITQFDEADISELEVFRQENKQAADVAGVKLTPLAFIVKAVVSGLKHFPQFNASLAGNGEELILKKYFNIGIAVDTPNGLMVPVLKEADCKGLFDIAKEIADLSNLAREGKLKENQMRGSCFSISSLGSIGGTAFTPIINAPDVAILGLSKAQIKPIYIEGKFEPRKMLPLSLSYDHRVIDGVEGAKFITHLVTQLQDIRKLIL